MELKGDELRAMFRLQPVIGGEREKEEGVELEGPWSTFWIVLRD